MSTVQDHAVTALRGLVQQTVLAGASRRAALLHMDRMPPLLTKPHHQRLARTALSSLSDRDHAQTFELPRGRLAIVWRSRGPDDVTPSMQALELLLADLPNGQAVPLGQLISLFDLPDQAPWLLDNLDEPPAPAAAHAQPGLDLPLLAQLEDILVHADLSPFLRWRPVMDLTRAGAAVAWEERSISLPDFVQTLCPGRTLEEGTWLFRRLARSIDRRVLALITGPRDLSGSRPFSLNIGVATILSPAFVAFDAALPAGLRGRVVLCLDPADILADAASTSFARNFAHARAYRLLLRDGQPGLLDAAAAGLDYQEVALTPEVMAAPARLPARERLVLSHVDDAAHLAWARAQGCLLARGNAFLP